MSTKKMDIRFPPAFVPRNRLVSNVAILVWKLIKVTFKSLLWFILAGIIAFLIFPKALVAVGGIGFLVIGFLIALIVLAIGGLLVYENE